MTFRRMVSIAAMVVTAAAFGLSSSASADSAGPITFEAPTYAIGNIDSQDGWTKTGVFDVAVADVSAFANAAGFGFGDQALRLSNAVTSGSFGDQTFSPGLTDLAGESSATHFEASFSIGSTQETEQAGLALSVSPDDGNGSRMSYVSFSDQADGIHVTFYDTTNAGPLNTATTWNGTEVAILDRTSAHTIRFSIDFVPGPANDVVELYVDGALVITGTTWEDYYRYDPEQNGNSNVVPVTSKLLFRAAGTAVPGISGAGYLVDGVSLLSSSAPSTRVDCRDGGWESLTRADASTFNNQGDCIQYVNTGN